LGVGAAVKPEGGAVTVVPCGVALTWDESALSADEFTADTT
jgi:hypothetical protein